jgi:hypothetical protein
MTIYKITISAESDNDEIWVDEETVTGTYPEAVLLAAQLIEKAETEEAEGMDANGMEPDEAWWFMFDIVEVEA